MNSAMFYNVHQNGTSMARPSRFMEVLWLQKATMIHSFVVRPATHQPLWQGLRLPSERQQRGETENHVNFWLQRTTRTTTWKCSSLAKTSAQDSSNSERRDGSCKIVVETPQNFSEAKRSSARAALPIPPSQSLLQPCVARQFWATTPQISNISQALLKAKAQRK